MSTPTGHALLLDLGGVVHRSAFELLPRDPRLHDVLACLGPFGTERDEAWHRMQRQEISEREYWLARAEEIGQALGHQGWTLAEIGELTTGRVTEDELVRPQAWQLLAAARARGVGFGVLTNDLSLFHDQGWVDRQRFLAEIDALVDCSVDGVLKPDPRAYRSGAAALGREPEQVVFLDDQPWNVDGARAVGMTAFQVDLADPGLAFAQACRYLGLESAPV